MYRAVCRTGWHVETDFRARLRGNGVRGIVANYCRNARNGAADEQFTSRQHS
jgi:hypothetical protein